MIKLLILLFLFTANIFASTAQVVLMTSIKTPKIWYHKKSWNVNKTLERRFKKSFKESGYKVKVVHEATATDLSRELQDPKNKGLFWVSHSNQAQQIGSGIEVPDLVYTINGVDVKNLFQKIHPNMKYLALIGCRGESLLNKFKKEGYYNGNLDLQIFAFKKKVDPRSGLRKALKASLGHLGYKGRFRLRNFRLPNINTTQEQLNSKPHQCIEQNFLSLNIKRTANNSLGAASLTLDGKFIAFFPETKNTQQIQTIQIPTEFFNKTKKKKFTLQKMHNKNLKLGILDFSSDEDLNWKVFSKRDGTPIGSAKNLYLLQGDKNKVYEGNQECLKFD